VKILYVGYRDPLHSACGGYDKIAAYPHSRYLNSKNLPFGFIPIGKRGCRLNLICMDAAGRMQKNHYDIIHYFYGDMVLKHPLPKKKNAKFVATIHLNANLLTEKQFDVLKTFDGVVCLSTEQARYLKEKGLNAVYIPHGFDKITYSEHSKTFVDSGFDCKKINIFYSGMNYRDFDTFCSIASFVSNNPNIIFHALGQSLENKEKLVSYKNVVVYKRLSDDDYYSLLNLCDYSFLPLLFATANNSLFEAQGIGVTSIIPNIDGITDYADVKNNFLYDNIEQLKEFFLTITKKEKNTELVEYSSRFSWNAIYEQLEKFYCSLLGEFK
jgi:glycosyltransferase involved in cell wall biosynthesis